MGQGVIPYLVLELCPWINTPLSWPVCLLDDVQCVCVCVPELCSQTAGEPNDRCDANYLDQQIGVQRERIERRSLVPFSPLPCFDHSGRRSWIRLVVVVVVVSALLLAI